MYRKYNATNLEKGTTDIYTPLQPYIHVLTRDIWNAIQTLPFFVSGFLCLLSIGRKKLCQENV
jgi:hypothetical protein